MGIFTRVREHARRNAPHVSEHVRGSGSRAAKFSGEYDGKASEKFKETGEAARTAIQAELERRKQLREEEQALRQKIREEEMTAAEADRTKAKLERIRAEERLRAREGGLLRRTLRAGAASGFAALRKEAFGSKRRSVHHRKKKAAKTKHRKAQTKHRKSRRSAHGVRRVVTTYY